MVYIFSVNICLVKGHFCNKLEHIYINVIIVIAKFSVANKPTYVNIFVKTSLGPATLSMCCVVDKRLVP